MEKYMGEKIKEQRKTKKFTIANLSSKTGLSESLISRVEKGNVVPSINTLRKIAQGLDVSITDFFKDERDLEEEKIVVREQERKKLIIPGSKAKYEIITPDINKKIELLKVEIEPMCKEEKLIHLGYEEECAMVMKGEVDINLNNKTLNLKEGDCIYINRSFLGPVKNLRNEKALIILAMAHK